MAFLDLTAELSGMLPGLSPLLAETYVNRALSNIYDARRWSFLETDGVVVCPLMMSAGTASITQYSDSVTLDATASAAVLAQAQGTVPPGILQLQMRFGASPTLGGIYSIIACDYSTPTAIILTLDRVVQEATSGTAQYQIYRAYITPPISDFWRWESLVDFNNAITLTGNAITLSSAMFDIRDPQRTSQGLSYYLGGWGGNRITDVVTGATVPNATLSDGTPIYELWPHPTSGQTFYCRFRRKGLMLINPTDTQAPGIADELVIARALAFHAYPFAKANTGNFPSFKGVDWNGLIVTEKAHYKEQLQDAVRNDDAQQLQSVWNRGHGLRSGTGWGVPPYPIDAQYLQSHLVRF